MAIAVLYEDKDVLVICKPSGMLSEASEREASVVTALLSEGGCETPPAPITRLDREVSGVMMLAKTKEGAAFYSAQMSDRTLFRKEYLALVSGRLDEQEGRMQDLLFKDSFKNKSYVVKRMRRGVKAASLSYRVIAEAQANGTPVSLLHITLETGRTHQIRVQCSSRRHPLLGDGRYGGDPSYPMGLLSYRLSFRAKDGKTHSVCLPYPQNEPFSIFDAQTVQKSL
ncbi:MAG: RluA family pseudouridine synthase [Clostridia bacterium]|nr:RluA family pseudouridine synthase [Clostridia bacterium]